MKHILITLIAALATLVHSQPSNGQIGIPVWTANGTSTVWLTLQNNKVIGVNGSGNLEMVAGGGSSTLGALTDVSLTSLTSGQLLQYNGTGWVNWTPTYAPTNSPTFTGTVTIPSGASIAGYLTSATAASTYQHLGYPSLLGSPPGQLNMNAGADNDMTLDLGGVGGSITTSGGNADVAPGGNGGIITTAGNLSFAGGSLIMNSNGANAAGSLNTQSGGNLTMGTGDLAGGDVSGTILTTAGDGSSLTALNASALGSGEIPAARMPALTGDVTTSAGAVATTIATGAVGPTQLASTAVAAGSYTSTNLTVDADGRITAASNGSAGATLSANTFTGQNLFTAAGAASTSSVSFTGAPYKAGTATTNHPLIYINQAGATAPTNWSTKGTSLGMSLPAADSYPVHGDAIRVLVDNTPVFSVDKSGGVYSSSVLMIGTSVSSRSHGISTQSSSRMNLIAADTYVAAATANGLFCASGTYFGWSDGTSYSGTVDTAMRRESAGVIQVNNGTLNTRRDLSLRNLFSTDYIEGTEMAAPAAPAANKGRIYFEDSGGKTRLMVIFPTGAAQQIAIEP